MREFDLSSLGVEAIAGDDVCGGVLSPLIVAIVAGAVAAAIANWKDIKAGFADGWNDA